MNKVIDLSVILAAHASQAPSMTIIVDVDGGKHKLKGVSQRLVQIGIPTVTLLTDDSTTQRFILSGDASVEFTLAAHELVRKGTAFYTQMRPDWNIPMIFWQKA